MHLRGSPPVAAVAPPRVTRPGFHVPPPLASAVAAVLSALTAPALVSPVGGPSAAAATASAAGVATRRHLLTLAASSVAAAALLPAPPALAVESFSLPGSAKGTKRDGGYRRCLSGCLARCMAPPRDGGGAKERSVCVVECKDECAETEEQL